MSEVMRNSVVVFRDHNRPAITINHVEEIDIMSLSEYTSAMGMTGRSPGDYYESDLLVITAADGTFAFMFHDVSVFSDQIVPVYPQVEEEVEEEESVPKLKRPRKGKDS